MKRGPKALPDPRKAARGDFRPARAVTGEVVSIGDPPQMPSFLSAQAQEVWIENIGRVMGAGIAEADSDLFATYCASEALSRAAFKAGEPPPAAYLSELRKMRELLGIAGPASRGKGKVPNGPAPENPFARNGHRARA